MPPKRKAAAQVDADADIDYERQREDNIKANIELMKSLGLYRPELAPRKAASSPTKRKRSESGDGAAYDPSADLETSTFKRLRGRPRTSSSTTTTTTTAIEMSKQKLSQDNTPRRRSSRARSSVTPGGTAKSLSGNVRRHSLATFIANDNDDDDDEEKEDTRQRKADKLGKRRYSPKRFGHIPGVEIGRVWNKRMECSTDAVHAPTVAGISGNPQDGCWSVCLSGGYEDDFDNGDEFTYTGSGGRDLKGTKENPKNLRTAPQSRDQDWTHNPYNASLYRSMQTKKPIRVVRGFKAKNRYAPSAGYVYSGLYRCTNAWMATGQAGFKVCRFSFERLADQAPLPTFDHEAEGAAGADEGTGAGEGGGERTASSASSSGRSGRPESSRAGSEDEVESLTLASPAPSATFEGVYIDITPGRHSEKLGVRMVTRHLRKSLSQVSPLLLPTGRGGRLTRRGVTAIP